jgi:hypothetical protein
MRTSRYRGGSSRSAAAMGVMTYSKELVSAAPLTPNAAAAFEPAAVSFQRPGPDVLSETIPVVFIGRNRDGFWVVRDAEARFGGLFWRKQAALDFAKTNASTGGYAAVFPQLRFELDMENHGNPLIGIIMTARRLLARRAQPVIAATRKLLAF